MYKSKLQDMCHRKKWGLPEYATVRDGPDHRPRFTGTVTVNGVTFESPPGESRSSKEAQNEAAKMVVDYFSDPSFTPPQQPIYPNSPSPQHSPSGSSNSSANLDVETTKAATVEPNSPQSLLVCETLNSFGKDESDMLHLYKNRLQNYAQKRNLTLPTYSYEIDGPPHARYFKSKVTVDGKSFETTNVFSTLKDAEHSVAKVAFESMSLHETQEDEGLYKSLLQEFAQKSGFQIPAYETERYGLPHAPIFISTVKIGGKSFQGEKARTKKLAEMDAAKVAYIGLTECRARQSSAVGYHCKGHLEASSSNLQPNVIEKVNEDVNNSIEGHAEEIKDTNGKRHENSSASEDAHAQEQDPSSATKSPPRDTKDGASSSSLSMLISNIKAGVKAASGEQGSDVKMIMVCPRTPNMTIPKGVTILPVSDDQWVAMRLPADDNNN